MYASLIHRQRAAGRAFWLAILLSSGTAAADRVADLAQAAPVSVAWGIDDDPDEGGQSARATRNPIYLRG